MKIIIRESVKVESYLRNLYNGGYAYSVGKKWRGRGSENNSLNVENGGEKIYDNIWMGAGVQIK